MTPPKPPTRKLRKTLNAMALAHRFLQAGQQASSSFSNAVTAQRRRDAVHESGHATIAHVLAVPIDNVSVEADPLKNSSFKFGQFTNESDPETLTRIALVSAAGGIAEQFLEPDAPRHPHPSDDSVIRKALSRCNGVASDFAQVEAGAVKLVALHWDKIQALAAELDRRGSMSGADVAAFLNSQSE